MLNMVYEYVKGRFQKQAWLSQLYGGSLGKNNQIKESREFISLWRPLLWKPGTNLIPLGCKLLEKKNHDLQFALYDQ